LSEAATLPSACTPSHCSQIVVAPRPGGGIAHARTHHDSPYGRIEVAWRQGGERGSIDVTVPPGSEAELVLPDGHAEPLAAGRHHRTWRAR